MNTNQILLSAWQVVFQVSSIRYHQEKHPNSQALESSKIAKSNTSFTDIQNYHYIQAYTEIFLNASFTKEATLIH